jgi:hypothetical protein
MKWMYGAIVSPLFPSLSDPDLPAVDELIDVVADFVLAPKAEE